MSDEEIIDYLRKGWRSRVKTSGKYQYITLRTRDSERSIGRYTEELMSKIQFLEYKVSFEEDDVKRRDSNALDKKREERRRKAISFPRARDNLMKTLSISRGGEMSENCDHISDGFCTYWIWEDYQIFLKYFENVYKKGVEYKRLVSENEKDKRWIVKAGSFYCANCPAHRNENSNSSAYITNR